MFKNEIFLNELVRSLNKLDGSVGDDKYTLALVLVLVGSQLIVPNQGHKWISLGQILDSKFARTKDLNLGKDDALERLASHSIEHWHCGSALFNPLSNVRVSFPLHRISFFQLDTNRAKRVGTAIKKSIQNCRDELSDLWEKICNDLKAVPQLETTRDEVKSALSKLFDPSNCKRVTRLDMDKDDLVIEAEMEGNSFGYPITTTPMIGYNENHKQTNNIRLVIGRSRTGVLFLRTIYPI